MKSLIISILERYLVALAKVVLSLDKPLIIGITGSVGKTTVKEAIAHLLETAELPVRKTEGNLNFDIGIAMTVLGYDHAPAIWEWPWALLKVHAVWLLYILRVMRFPKYFVVEMGIDRLGDMTRLTRWVKPSVGIVTWIGEGHHLEFLKDAKTVAREKGQMLRVLPADGLAVLPEKDPNLPILKELSAAPVELFAQTGIESINDILQILAKRFSISEATVAKAQQSFVQPKGRLNILGGLNETQILDDSYNTSLPAIRVALDKLAQQKAKRRIAVLGDILEQGQFEESFHQQAAEYVRKKADLFIGVGKRMAKVNPDHWFASPDEAAEALIELLQPGDVVLVKGSQGMRMEKISLALSADKTAAKKVLPRQTKRWEQIPFANP